MFEGLLTWTNEFFGSMGVPGLFLLAVIESIFFPVPVEVLLIVLAAANPDSWFFLAMVATIGSVIGASIGYRLGYVGNEYVLSRFCPEKYIKKIHNMFQRYETLTVFIAGFTPIPYKVVAIAAGMFYVRFIPFIIVSFIARGLRFSLVAFLTAWALSHGALMNWAMILGVLIAVEAWLAHRIWFRDNFKKRGGTA